MKNLFIGSQQKSKMIGKLAVIVLSVFTKQALAQVGVGTQQPQELLHVHNGSVLSTSVRLKPELNPYYDPSFPDSVQYKMKWFHDKAAFRSLGERVETAGWTRRSSAIIPSPAVSKSLHPA